MSDRRRNLFMIGLFIFITAGIFFFGRFLSVDDLSRDQDYLKITRTVTTQPTAINTPTPSPLPYDPMLYAQRQQEELMLRTGAGPTQYAIFMATEQALIATYQGTILPSFTPIPYTADMSPTALPPPTYLTRTTPTPTLCPPSDVVCPGGNATLSPPQRVFQLMASAEGTEYAQLALTATALATSPTPTERVTITLTPKPSSSVRDSNCAFSWAHQDLPEIAKAAQEAFSTIDTKIEVLRADAYGENCNRADGSPSYFGAMTTDFYLNANVSDLNKDYELAQIVVTTYNTLTALNVQLPARPGYLDIQFTANGATKHFRAMFDQVKAAMDAGKDSESLLEIGGLG